MSSEASVSQSVPEIISEAFSKSACMYFQTATSLKEATSGSSSSDALPLLSGLPVVGPLIYIDGIKSITLPTTHLRLYLQVPRSPRHQRQGTFNLSVIKLGN